MTDSKQTSQGQVVAFALPFWGHTKPLCALLAKIVRLRGVYVTLFTEASILNKVVDELARQCLPENEEHLRNLIRVVALQSPHALFQFDSYQSAFVEGYRTLYEGGPLATSTNSEVIYEALATPQLVILDFFCYKAMTGIRSISGSTVPIYAWQTGAVSAVLFLFGPESMGGNGDLAEKFSKIETEDQEMREKEIMAVYRRLNSQLVEIPGIPPMYDHEYVPQISALPVNSVVVALMTEHAHRFLVESDGIINVSSRLYEGRAIDKLQEWFSTRPVVAVGPLFPTANISEMVAKSHVEIEVEAFLNNAVDRLGPNSIIYISFGTVWWSAEPEKIWTIIDVLIEEGIPFLFSHASPMADIPEEVSAKVQASGLGFMAPWLPQQMILHHKACGWFITHCGHNSVMESLTAGVPLICWPYDVDQPLNAANISAIHNAGYELLEVRNGHGLRPLHRLGDKSPEGTIDAVRREAIEVFNKARGEDGKKKREKAQWFSEKFTQSSEQGGMTWIDLNKIVDVLA